MSEQDSVPRDPFAHYVDLVEGAAANSPFPMVGMRILLYTDDQGTLRYSKALDQHPEVPVPVATLLGMLQMVITEISTEAIKGPKKGS